MKQTSEQAAQESTKKAKGERTCPLCRSPLISEAIEAGKCQCCGHRFDPNDIENTVQQQA